MANLTSTIINGNVVVTDKIIKSGGTSKDILLANGELLSTDDIGGAGSGGLDKIVTSINGGTDNHIAIFDGSGRKIKDSSIETNDNGSLTFLKGGDITIRVPHDQGWARGICLESQDTDHQRFGDIGMYGTGKTLLYYYLGRYSDGQRIVSVNPNGVMQLGRTNCIQLDPASTNSAITLYHTQNDKRLTIRTSDADGAAVLETPSGGKLWIDSTSLLPNTTTITLGSGDHPWPSAYVGSGGITSTGTNKFITNTNAFNFVGASGWDDVVYFNWSGGNIKEYRFMKGDDKYDYSPLRASKFIKSDGKADDILMADGSTKKLNTITVDLSGYMPKSGGKFSGPIYFPNNTALPDKNLEFVCGIDAFVAGGQLGWQSKSSFLSEYATQSWVNSQGFLKSHQSLDGYATQSWVNSQGFLKSHQSLTNYVTLNTTQTITGHKQFSTIAVSNDCNLISHSNEFNFIPNGFSSTIHINYRALNGSGTIDGYRFCNGTSSLASIYCKALYLG